MTPRDDRIESEELIRRTSELFGVLSDSTRVKIIMSISRRELCVGDIAREVGVSDSAASHQLRVLRNMRMVDRRREGRLSFYSLRDEHIKSILEQSLRHVSE